ncbi:nuclease domain-containing protein [Paraburkholderia agricolaris]|uniref:nuclease domain-containing protein n=1 Tax=Paraburkholderia agricolaris TaxID=2152888 RepID=UPI003CCD9D62
MKRSAPMQRKTPLARTGFKRQAPAAAFKTTFHTKTVLRNAALKTRRKRVTVAEGGKYLAACRGEPCYLRVPGVCPLNPNDETIVPCHENSLAAGKGMGLKSNHARTLPGCFWCHAWLDQGKADRLTKGTIFQMGMNDWLPRRARKMGLEMQEAA